MNQSFKDNEGKEYTAPISLNPFSLLARADAWMSVWVFGVCPKCGSAVSKRDTCVICEGEGNLPLSENRQFRYWNKWKYLKYKQII